MIRLWLEWDLGQDDLTFNSKEDAKLWLETESGIIDALSDAFSSVQEDFGQRLVAYQPIEVWTLKKGN